MYKVTIDGEFVGYVTDKEFVENAVNSYIVNKQGNITIADVKNIPCFELNLVQRAKEDSTVDVIEKAKESAIVTYKVFEITVGEDITQYVSTENEANEIAEELKNEYNGIIDLKINIQEKCTTDLDIINFLDVQIAKVNLNKKIISNCASSINGVILSKPVSGTVSSRYGSRWGRQHEGLDVAATTGTKINSCGKGTVKFVGVYGGYGNLVIVDHGNGVETYYAHCSKIYVAVGDKVTNDTVIATVGSTGNSTGPHLHLEIRKNGVVQNPQKYLYN